MKWYKATVLKGQQTGRTIGFPTVNLDPDIIPASTPTGVYSAIVKYNNTDYKGALYYGPRLVKNETQNVLEIYIINFNKEIYGDDLSFTIGQFIREVKSFPSLEDLKRQLQADVRAIRELGSR